MKGKLGVLVLSSEACNHARDHRASVMRLSRVLDPAVAGPIASALPPISKVYPYHLDDLVESIALESFYPIAASQDN